jgi:hypothetical protein
MSNSFGGGGADLDLSNGATDVFLSVLQFALSDLATDPWQRALARWVAWHDQNVAGRGTVGFDLEEIHWGPADFARQKAFLLQVIDTAATGYRWSELCYDPPHAVDYLHRYREIVEAFELPPDFRPVGGYAWPGPDDEERLCRVHRVHCYPELGWCRVCDDCGLGDAALWTAGQV